MLSEQGAIDPVGERIYSLEQSEIAFRELAAGGHKVMHQLCNTILVILLARYRLTITVSSMVFYEAVEEENATMDYPVNALPIPQ